ncbi:hypothetical protein [Stenotrophomonas oahuensis]|uniref:Uncharacterized protein n=1 Tax=Stenotrophomonas oahuensis TaxID=3003271 RepID=A0ABY9YJ54_9GAMM|nr:hypothetical protein [Stenotrophomonas sp. A5586]WNH50921.1 hypothetical protein PDM29_11015 [Stenotrophomonas sp. A5586]
MPKLPFASFAPFIGGKLSNIFPSAVRNTAPTSLSNVVRQAYENRMSPKMAAAALRSAVNAFPVQDWIVPARHVSQQSLARRMDPSAGLNCLRQDTHEALLYLANRKDGELKSVLKHELGVALSDGHTAEAHWVRRLITAHGANDHDTVALATTILGEHHPAVAHLRDPAEHPHLSMPSTHDPLAGKDRHLPVLQAVKHMQSFATLHAICNTNYQLDQLESTQPVTEDAVRDRLAGAFAPLSLALRDITLAHQYVSGLKDPATRVVTQPMLSRMQEAIPAAIAYWQSVLSRRGLEQSPGLAEMACSWLGEDDLAVIAFRASAGRAPAHSPLPPGAVEWSNLVSSASSSSSPLHTAQQTCESVISEVETTWEEAEPLITDADAEEFDPPPAAAVLMHAETESPAYQIPQDPSVERLRDELKLRRAPLLAFVRGLYGTPPF